MRFMCSIVCLLLMATIKLTGQGIVPAVTNVTTTVSEERDKVTITYDLARKPGVSGYNVAIRITLDDEVVPALALSGDVGPNISPGYGKRVVWDVYKDVSELYGSLQVEVTANANEPDCVPIKTVPVYAGLAGAGAAGVTLILSGLQMESDSDELYEIYKNNLDPNDPQYDELSREEHYNEANSKHKTGTWLTIGGAAVLAAGGTILVSRLIQIRKYNKKCAGKTSMLHKQYRLEPIFITDAGNGQMGAGLRFHF